MSPISCGFKRNSAAPMTPSTWSAERMPTMAAVTAGCRRVQAMATSPGVRPWRAPIWRQQFGEIQVASEQRLLEARGAAAEIVVGHGGDALAGHRAGQQARLHGRVDDDADAVRLREGQRRFFDLRGDHRVRRLQRGNRRDLAARSSCAALKFETPIQRTLPSSFSLASAVQPSSMSSSGSGQWI